MKNIAAFNFHLSSGEKHENIVVIVMASNWSSAGEVIQPAFNKETNEEIIMALNKTSAVDMFCFTFIKDFPFK